MNEYGPSTRNPKSLPLLQYLLSDFATEVHSTEFAAFVKEKRIKPLNSTPYKHAQNLIERFVQSFKNMIRTTLYTNSCPIRYWCYAAQYSAQTYNKLQRKGTTISRDEAFYGIKADVSNCVPFYEHGWAYVSPEERAAKLKKGSTKALSDRGTQIRCLGYADPYEIPNNSLAEAYIKNAYVCLNLEENKIMPRHDCLWNSFIPGGLSQITPNTSNSEDNITSNAEEYDYDLLFDGPAKDLEGWRGDPIIKTTIPDDPDGIPLVEEIPISSSEIPEDLDLLEVRSLGGSSDTDKSEKGKEIPTPSSEGVRKTPAPKSLIKNKRKHLQRKAKKLASRELYMQKANYVNVDTDPVHLTELIDNSILQAAAEALAAANPNLKDASGSSHDCANKKRSRGEASEKDHSDSSNSDDEDKFDDENRNFHFGFSMEYENDPFDITEDEHFSDAKLPRNLPEALASPEGIHWKIAWETEMERLGRRISWVDITDEAEMIKHFGLDYAHSIHTKKPIKSKYAFRVTVNIDGTLKYRCRLVGCGYSQIFGRDYD